jgi:hypothetical protein
MRFSLTDVESAIGLSERLKPDFASGVGIHGLTNQCMKINCADRLGLLELERKLPSPLGQNHP